ncbi:MAG TPA: hypothetical protein H9830_11540 [Candidatus Agrococcus pullicola]|uniref:Uncharacterized protein n=1 Tax=Candidatus Agrococcus pullicola TaxID=2838429 RepID=A0A9D1YW49_9MICO|nr:hypothetical protein [Candidatus Agrococcus pullicola]
MAGSSFRAIAGLVKIAVIQPVTIDDLTDADARRSGRASAPDLIETLKERGLRQVHQFNTVFQSEFFDNSNPKPALSTSFLAPWGAR